jgi:hypothetical protein
MVTGKHNVVSLEVMKISVKIGLLEIRCEGVIVRMKGDRTGRGSRPMTCFGISSVKPGSISGPFADLVSLRFSFLCGTHCRKTRSSLVVSYIVIVENSRF